MQIWILTFNRPASLNRLISKIGKQGAVCNVLSNSPDVLIESENLKFVEQVVVNPFNTSKSTSFCARSWNHIYLKAFQKDEELAAFQDDTDITPHFIDWINNNKQKYHFIWGPAGDQFHFINKIVLQKIGWWDERYNGCFCADADYLKRVIHEYDQNKISVEEYHGWGFHHNKCDITNAIIPCDFGRSNEIVDNNYLNQYYAYTNIDRNNRVINSASKHFLDKWDEELTPTSQIRNSYRRKLKEVDWYPWASFQFEIGTYGE